MERGAYNVGHKSSAQITLVFGPLLPARNLVSAARLHIARVETRESAV